MEEAKKLYHVELGGELFVKVNIGSSPVSRLKTTLTAINLETGDVENCTITNLFKNLTGRIRQVGYNDELRFEDKRLVKINYCIRGKVIKIKISNITCNSLCIDVHIIIEPFH